MSDFNPSALTRLRQGNGLRQKDLAQLAGLSTSVVSSLEAGQTPNPRADTVTKLAAALGCRRSSLYKRATTAVVTREAGLNREALRQLAAERAPARREEKLVEMAPQPQPLPLPLFDDALHPGTRTITRAEANWLLHNLPARWRVLFTGCREAGFDEAQAMRLVTTAISAGVLPV